MSDAAKAHRLSMGTSRMSLQDYVDHPSAKLANLSECHVMALRLYTSSSYRLFDVPLRNGRPSVLCIALDQALRQLRAVGLKTDE